MEEVKQVEPEVAIVEKPIISDRDEVENMVLN
jgi:hypothetical protein